MEKFKSKKILICTAILLVVAIAVLFTGCGGQTIDVNYPQEIDATLGEQAYAYMQTFAGDEHSARTLGTEGELDSAKYIASLMLDMGYESPYGGEDTVGLQEFKTTFKRYTGENVVDAKAYNVIFSKKSTSQDYRGEIILACQYDNLYSEKADISGNLWNADGSYESGASISLLLTLAGVLKDAELDYDLTFAFFTGGCYEWKGAMNYVDTLDRAALDKIALVLNFSMLAGGDNWYIYSGESNTTYGNYLNLCGKGYVTALPKDRNIGQFSLTDDAIFNYVNIGMLSNHYYFDLKSIPTANFLSLNWSINSNPLFSEMNGKDNVYHTKSDTLANMIERKGEEGIKAQLQQVAASTLVALDSSNQDSLQNALSLYGDERVSAASQSGKGSNMANIILKVVLIAGLIVTSYLLKLSINKNIGKLIEAKKVKEGQADGQSAEMPFETESNAQSGEEQVLEKQKSEEKAKKEQDEDPFAN